MSIYEVFSLFSFVWIITIMLSFTIFIVFIYHKKIKKIRQIQKQIKNIVYFQSDDTSSFFGSRTSFSCSQKKRSEKMKKTIDKLQKVCYYKDVDRQLYKMPYNFVLIAIK